MAVELGPEPVKEFSQWYERYEVDPRDNTLRHFVVAKCGQALWKQYDDFKREADGRLASYGTLEKLLDGKVIKEKPDLPNVSSGETAGLIRRMARNLVQNTPNVDVISIFDDDSPKGIFSRHILTSKIIGTDQYSNDMQQHLFCSTKMALTLGFDCVVPTLLKDASNGYYIKYDTIHYRDVFPDPGVKDVREAADVFVRRYLTRSEAIQICREEQPGWDHVALYTMLKSNPPSRRMESLNQQDKKHSNIPVGYEIITWYSRSGNEFLTFDANTKMLLRIEKNKHPLKEHPVFFLVMERDDLQPFGKSQVELLIGRQDFQDLMLNGAMKLWYRNINPSILGFGAANAVPNLGPGKFTAISNPNARIEAFEVNTGTLQQFGTISEQNLGSMVNLVGAADQQMATQAGNGMSATPQGVEAQQQMVDVTTNNYQKAIEGFFSHYCSYALTVYFHELKAIEKVVPTAEARIRLMKAGLKPYDPQPEVGLDGEPVLDDNGQPKMTNAGDFNDKGELELNFKELATEYFVRCVPGSLTELEDEKEIRLLNQMFVPLSQALPAIAAAQDPEILRKAALAMQYIIQKQLELSGSVNSRDLVDLWRNGDTERVQAADEKIAMVTETVGGLLDQNNEEMDLTHQRMDQMGEQIKLLTENNRLLMEKLGIAEQPSETTSAVAEVPV